MKRKCVWVLVCAGLIVSLAAGGSVGSYAAEAQLLSADYSEAYEFVSENAAKIIMIYMQNGDAVLSEQMTLPEDEFEKFIDSYDSGEYALPEESEEASDVRATAEEEEVEEEEVEEEEVEEEEAEEEETEPEEDEAEAEEDEAEAEGGKDFWLDAVAEAPEEVDRELFLGNGGVNAYFAEDDLVNDLKDLNEETFLASVKTDDCADLCHFSCVNQDYALVYTDPVIEIEEQLENNSGYYVVRDIVERFGWDMGSTRDDTLDGRLDAMEDYLQEWEDARAAWDAEFLEDYGMSTEDSEEDADGADSGNGMGGILYMLIDRDGRILSSYVAQGEMNASVKADGRWELWTGSQYLAFEKDGTVIYDLPNQKHVFADEEAAVSGLTPSLNMLTIASGNDFEHGDYTTLELLKPDGSTMEIMESPEGASPHIWYSAVDEEVPVYRYGAGGDVNAYDPVIPSDYDYTNLWTVEFTYGFTDDVYYIDMETGEAYSDKEYKIQDGMIVPSSTEETEEEGDLSSYEYVQISPDYYLERDTYDVYSKDNFEKRVANLSAGQGVRELMYNEEEDVYWVLTETLYLYKLDGEFNMVSDPVNIETIGGNTALNDRYEVTPYGLFMVEEVETPNYDPYYYGILYDENGDVAFCYDMGIGRAYKVDGFSVTQGFLTCSLGPCLYNLSNFKIVRVTKPDAD